MKTTYTAEEWRNRKTGRAKKYGNKRLKTADGWFDSKGEWKRWAFLKAAERRGDISALERQVTYDIKVNGALVTKYVADYVYTNAAGQRVVEDFKGTVTREFRLKAKLIKALYDIEVKIVKTPNADLD